MLVMLNTIYVTSQFSTSYTYDVLLFSLVRINLIIYFYYHIKSNLFCTTSYSQITRIAFPLTLDEYMYINLDGHNLIIKKLLQEYYLA